MFFSNFARLQLDLFNHLINSDKTFALFFKKALYYFLIFMQFKMRVMSTLSSEGKGPGEGGIDLGSKRRE